MEHGTVIAAKIREKMRADDRELVLEKIEGKDVKSNIGLVDNRLFKGETKLYAYLDERTLLWKFKYSAGLLPQPLQQSFTSFKKLKEFAESYFARRGLKLVKVID
jgi:hypothetical protein